MKMRHWAVFVIVTATAIACALIFFSRPYLWVFTVWLLACVYAAVVSRTTLARAVWVNLGAAVLALWLLEAYLHSQQAPADAVRYEGRYTQDYFIRHDLLGYAPGKGISATARKLLAGTKVYEVVYTIGQDGLRVAPPHKPDATGCVLFFGDSLTFGEGVADEQTMPYRVGVKSAGRYRVYNFAFHGYGPHQMLAQLEQGVVQHTIDCRPQHAIYQAIVPHIARAAGRAFWDRHGPRYRITPDNQIVFSGHFSDAPAAALVSALRLQDMLIYARLLGDHRPYDDADIELFLGIVQRARDVFEGRYPQGKFHVLLWHYQGDQVYDKVMDGLRARRLDVRAVEEILPDYALRPARYEIGAHDTHPSVHAHDLIADYVVAAVLARPPLRQTAATATAK